MIKEDFVIQSEVRRVLIRSNIDYAKIDFGTVRGVKGERERAEKHLSIALRLNSKYREALLNLGYLFLETGRFKRIEKTLLREARREYRRILKVTPEDEHVRKRLEKISP